MTKLRIKTAKKPGVQPSDVNPTTPDIAGIPTTEQLAMIAAALARTSNPLDFMPSLLTTQALELWDWSQETIRLARFEDRFGQQEKKRRDAEADLTLFFKPSDKYPVTRDEMLKKLLPQLQGRREKFAEIGEAYWGTRLLEMNLVNRIYKRPTPEEINVAYENWGPFRFHAAAATEALRFKMWHDEYVISKRIATGKRNSARIRTRNNRKFKNET